MKTLSSKEMSKMKAGQTSLPDILVTLGPGISGAAMGFGGISGTLVSYWVTGSSVGIQAIDAYNAQ